MTDPLAATVAELLERVTRLETALSAQGPGVTLPFAVAATAPISGETPERGLVMYAGSGPWGESSVAWRMERSWDEIVAHDPESLVLALSALANSTRLRIVRELVAGPAGTGELAERLDIATSGQLFHHLKELLAARVVHQRQRGLYALRPQHVLPLLAVLSAVSDLGLPTDTEPS